MIAFHKSLQKWPREIRPDTFIKLEVTLITFLSTARKPGPITVRNIKGLSVQQKILNIERPYL